MFSSLINYIKPLVRKDLTTTKAVAKSRAIDEEAAEHDDEFQDLLDVDINPNRYKQHKRSTQMADDPLELSLHALRLMVDQCENPPTDRLRALDRLDRLEQRGIKTLSVDPSQNIVSQINND